ncbi:MAG: hypothetical protein ACTHJ5_03925 [Ilyomonas sp.]
MKIAFICGSLKPGYDGIGDYVYCLAEELAHYGHEVAAIAINDWYIDKTFRGTHFENHVKVNVVRIPFSYSNGQRYKDAVAFIQSFKPEWISIQFGPYSFHPKGLPLLMAFYLKKLCRRSNVHIMIHETWIEGENIYRKFISVLQKHLIKHLLKSIDPKVIHTHIPEYLSRLQALGFITLDLPLFSNIKVRNDARDEFDTSFFRIGFFSQAGNIKPVLSFLSALGKQLVEKNMPFEVLLIGGAEAKMLHLKKEIEKIVHFSNKVKYAGFLAPPRLSKLLKSCTIGITPVPRHALGKSGSVSAFLSHGVPVAAPFIHQGYDKNNIGFSSNTLRSAIILEVDFKNIEGARLAAIAAKKEIEVYAIAKKFLKDIQNSIHVKRKYCYSY